MATESYVLNWKMLLCRKGAKSGRRYVMRQHEYFDLEYEGDSAVSCLGSHLASIQEKLEINLKVGAQ